MSNQINIVKTQLNKLYKGSGLKLIQNTFGIRTTLILVSASTVYIYVPAAIIIQLITGVSYL